VQRLSPSGGCGGLWRSGVTEARRMARQKAQRRRERGHNRGGMTVVRKRAQRRRDGGATVVR